MHALLITRNIRSPPTQLVSVCHKLILLYFKKQVCLEGLLLQCFFYVARKKV